MKKKLLILIAVLLANMLCAQNRVSVAKPRIGAGAVSNMQLNMVKGEIEKALSKKGFTIVSRVEVDEMVKDFDFSASGKLTNSELTRLAPLDGVDYICLTTISNEGDEYYITAKFVNKRIGIISNPASIYMDGGLGQLTVKSGDLAGELSSLCSIASETNPEGRGSTFGSSYTEKTQGLNMMFVRVQGGNFMMGCTEDQGGDCENDEGPAHNVQVSTFYMGVCEVTQAQWKKIMGTDIRQQQAKAGANSLRGEGDNYPMYYVSWEEANEFAQKLSKLTGKTYRLPTEAEWEYASRGGSKGDETMFSGSNNADAVAWYYENSGEQAHPVGQKRSNSLGLYDMSGNVWEWCSDWYGKYNSSYQENPAGPVSGERRVDRGGGWFNDARYCRVALRYSRKPNYRGSFLGFRLVLVP